MKNNYIRILFLVIVLILIAVSFITYRNLNNYIVEVNGVRHSNQVIRAVSSVLASIRDAETGHRGYQLTRDTVYLEPYYLSVKILPAELKKLDSLLAKNERQKQYADTLKMLIENQFTIISQILSNARRSSLYMDQYESNLLARGKVNMDQIRRIAFRITGEEENTSKERISKETNFRNYAPVSLLAYTLVALVGMTYLFTRILDSLSKKKIAEENLQRNVEFLKGEVAAKEERGLLLKEAETLAHIGSWRWYSKGDLLIWSEGLYTIWGLPHQDIKPSWSAFLSNVHRDDRQGVEDFLNKIKTEKTGSDIHCRIDVQGTVKYVLMTAKRREDAGTQSIDILGTVVDITKQKLYESQLKQFTEELQRSNQDLEQFAYVASHDLQEPLRKIRAFGDRLVSKYKPNLEGAGVDYIHRMQLAAARMQVLIEDLLSFSRVSRTGVFFEELNLNMLMVEVIDDLETQIRREQAAIQVTDLPPVWGEITQIKRLFQNLVSNAIKFHKLNEKPSIIISGQVIAHREAENELKITLQNNAKNYTRLSVKDNGIGFDQKYSEKVFNIFQRLHGRMEYEGTGIGLAICRKIVVNHNGYITVNSKENIGSEFIIILPTVAG